MRTPQTIEQMMKVRQMGPRFVPTLAAGAISFLVLTGLSAAERGASPDPSFVGKHCSSCHDRDTKKGNLDLESISAADPARHAEIWEKVVRRLRARQMPPAEKKRPDESAYRAILVRLESSLDSAAAAQPNPGRTETLRRL